MANDLRIQRISIPDFIHYIFCPIFILQKEPVFPFIMFSAKQGNYWYHFITSLVWRGPWLGIEPGTSRTRCQHSTTRLSRRRLVQVHWNQIVLQRFFCSLFFTQDLKDVLWNYIILYALLRHVLDTYLDLIVKLLL